MRYGNKLHQVLVCVEQIRYCQTVCKPHSRELQMIGLMDWVSELWNIVYDAG